MSHIITSQPRNPVTATYVILGTSIAYVLLWNKIPSDLVTKALIISVFGGIITSFVYYIEPLQRLGNFLLQRIHNRTVGKQFPKYKDVSYAETFGEPYFESDRNKIYGSIYLFGAIVIVLVRSPIPLSSIPLEILIGAGVGCVFLIVIWCFLIPKQWGRIREVHYILVLERYYPEQFTPEVVQDVKEDLLANRWPSAINRIEKAREEFYDEILKSPIWLSGYREKWKIAKFKFQDINPPFGTKSSIGSEIDWYGGYSRHIEDWLYSLNPRVYDLFCKVKELVEVLENKVKEELKLLLSDNGRATILEDISDSKGGLSEIYDDETFNLTDDNNIRSLHKDIAKKIKKRSETEPVPSENDVKDAVLKFRELRPIFESVIEKIEEVETCLNELEIKK